MSGKGVSYLVIRVFFTDLFNHLPYFPLNIVPYLPYLFYWLSFGVLYSPIKDLGNKQCGAETLVHASHVDDFVGVSYHLFG